MEANLKEIQADSQKKNNNITEYATADTTNFDGLKKAMQNLTQRLGKID